MQNWTIRFFDKVNHHIRVRNCSIASALTETMKQMQTPELLKTRDAALDLVRILELRLGLDAYTVRLVWLGSREQEQDILATSLSEALMMAERENAGRQDAPDVYGIRRRDYDMARAEGIEFNEADGLLLP